MKTAILTLVLASLASFGLCLKCAVCAGPSCDGRILTLECPDDVGVTAACATYTNQIGMLMKSCTSRTACDGTLGVVFADVECCYSDMCNSSSRLGTSFAFVFCLVLLKFFL